MEPVSGEFAVSIEVAEPGASAPLRELTGAILGGHFELVEVVGGGGMGTVYRARDTRSQRDVAVKVLDPRFDPARDPASRERFLREARLSTRLLHHNIVEVFESGESDGVHYLAMELLHGRTLAQVLEGEGVLEWPRALNFVRQMSAGLAFAHELGLVHRDLKPANCFVLGSGEHEWLKLLDFGLAKPMVRAGGDNEVTRTSVVMGSPTYMAPEQARGEASVQSDIYALGVMLFRMLAGRAPFGGRTAVEVIVNHIQSRLPWLSELTLERSVPLAVELVMRRCLEKDPRARFHSVQALLAAIDEAELEARREPVRPLPAQPPAANKPRPAQTSPHPSAHQGPLFQAVREPTGRTPWAVLVALMVLCGVAGAAWRNNWVALAKASPALAAPVRAEALQAQAVPEVAPGPVLFRINTIPTGAQVKLGTRVVGQTPTTFVVDLDATGEATAELTLELKGYQTITFIATSPGPRVDLVQRMQKGAGRVQLPGLVARRAEPVAANLPLGVPEVVSAATTSALAPAEAAAPAPIVVGRAVQEPEPVPAPVPVRGGPVPTEQLTEHPRLISGSAPAYSSWARVAKVEGSAVARCVLTARGRLEQCRLLKPLPFMNEAILESLGTRVYEPARVGAEAVATELNVVVQVSR
jgi:serine/threonine protein kinase